MQSWQPMFLWILAANFIIFRSSALILWSIRTWMWFSFRSIRTLAWSSAAISLAESSPSCSNSHLEWLWIPSFHQALTIPTIHDILLLTAASKSCKWSWYSILGEMVWPWPSCTNKMKSNTMKCWVCCKEARSNLMKSMTTKESRSNSKN
jgi:hypothetical protein